ncbi:MAG TPA: hypothetical protein EYQ00_11235 [Dehalococcoidia bacterium]|nr:hypothetical protein [Dehalococcoidia bacterium]
MPSKENPFDGFVDIFHELVVKRGITVRKATPKEPRGYIIVNPRDKNNILHLDQFGGVSFWNQETGQMRKLHGTYADLQLRLKVVLNAFQLG